MIGSTSLLIIQEWKLLMKKKSLFVEKKKEYDFKWMLRNGLGIEENRYYIQVCIYIKQLK